MNPEGAPGIADLAASRWTSVSRPRPATEETTSIASSVHTNLVDARSQWLDERSTSTVPSPTIRGAPVESVSSGPSTVSSAATGRNAAQCSPPADESLATIPLAEIGASA